MDLSLHQRRVCVIGDNADIGQICGDAFAAEGATLIAAERAEDADVVVAIERTFPPVAHEQISAAQLTAAWADIEHMAAVYRRALPRMKQQQWGRLIYVGSLAAKELSEQPEHIGRAVGLGALGMQKTLSGEIGPFGITCNSVLWDPRYLQGAERASGLTAIGAATAFLASDGAAYLTGISMTIDHAQSAGTF